MDIPDVGAGVNEDEDKRDLPLKNVVEAVLFVAPDPLPLRKLAALTDASPDELRAVIGELQGEYAGRGVELAYVGGGYRFYSRPEYAPWARQVLPVEKGPRLSRAAVETLAIVAYRQPVTRVAVEEVRGVNSDAVLKTLLEKKFIITDGREDAPGRPFRYRTTKKFLQHFGLAALNDLPPLKEPDAGG
jgi:segregation and condensation protein B